MTNLYRYGENSFTFLLFGSLAQKDYLKTILLARLKPLMGKKARTTLPPVPTDDPTVFLFPNFGKSSGFGEPDALVLVGDHVFWFEVETTIDVRSSCVALDQPLLQLFRFHLLAAALPRRSRTRNVGRRHLAFVAVTLRDGGAPRPAVLREKGHTILSKVKKQVAEAFAKENDHYVLLLDGVPQGIGRERVPQHVVATLARYQENIMSWCAENEFPPPRQPNVERFWYVYWEGDLKGEFEKRGLGNPLEDGGYMRIVSSGRR